MLATISIGAATLDVILDGSKYFDSSTSSLGANAIAIAAGPALAGIAMAYSSFKRMRENSHETRPAVFWIADAAWKEAIADRQVAADHPLPKGKILISKVDFDVRWTSDKSASQEEGRRRASFQTTEYQRPDRSTTTRRLEPTSKCSSLSRVWRPWNGSMPGALIENVRSRRMRSS